ncbi:MAG TPA: hypothetical protein VHE78_04055 [Gemmatimonadaceae bacterium]|nr:hypothetical protein [Gemmatimonadaceae bacterium]
MRKSRPLHAIPAVYGSVEVLDDCAIYTDEKVTRWRLHDFTSDGPARQQLSPGSPEARCRIYVREDGGERRRALFFPRHNTLTPVFNYHAMGNAAIRAGGQWVFTFRWPSIGPDRMTTSYRGRDRLARRM